MCSFYESFGFVCSWFLFLSLLFKILKGIWTGGVGAALGYGHRWAVDDNSWAIVTGSTDGIGLEYAKEMAKRGYNLLLLSRNQDKLLQTKDAIKANYPKCREIRTLAVDFGRTDIYDDIEQNIKNIGNVDVLVNNVGISYHHPEYFTKLENRSQLIDQIINVNIVSCTRMIDLVIPQMEKREKGVIINVSSLSGSYPTPLLTLYAASKAYVDYLSRGLHMEYADKGIIVQSILPAFVQTKMSKIRKSSLMVPTPTAYVQSALNTLGLESRSYGFWTHKLQGYVSDSLVNTLLGPDFNSKIYFNSLRDIRKKYYKKNAMKED